MKIAFQTLFLVCMLIITADLSSCSRIRTTASPTVIKGRLVNLLNQQPVPGLNVELRAFGYRDAPAPFMTHRFNSNAKGEFHVEFDALPGMCYELRLWNEKYELVNSHTSVRTGISNNQVLYLVPLSSESFAEADAEQDIMRYSVL
jgi:hypothetical protein